MNTATAGIAISAPTDIVFPGDDDELDVIFDRRTLKLIGSVHRRFWEKRRAMLQDRAIGEDLSVLSIGDGLPVTPAIQPTVECGDVIADLRARDHSWNARLEEYLLLQNRIERQVPRVVPPVVRIRGWEHTEAGLLVDGRSVPGCIVDIAVALSFGADLFRQGEQAFVFDIPEAADPLEAQLWADLFSLAQDRNGIERGTVLFGTVRASTSNRRELAVA